MTRACLYDGCPHPPRLYPSGFRCDAHAPWAEAGRPDPCSPVVENPTRMAAKHQLRLVRAEAEPELDPAWVADAKRAVWGTARERDTFTTDDVWARLDGPRDPRGLLTVLARAVEAGAVRDTGQRVRLPDGSISSVYERSGE